MKKKYILSAIASAASALLIISIAVMPKNTLPYSETEFSRQGTEPSSLSSRQESLSPVKESAPPTESKPRPESDLPSESSDTVETELKEPAAAETSEESENAEESAASVDLESTEETTSPSAIAGSENPPLSTETYTPVDYSQMKKYGTSAMMAVWPEDLKTLEEHAPIVFQGIPIESEDPILYYANSNFVMTGLTPTKLKVTKTFENSGDIEVGDVITILEKYYVTEFNGEEALFYLGNYLPSVNGKEYIYFTTKSEEDYVVTFMENSRFPVTSSSANLSSQNNSASVYEQLDVAEEADLKEYEGLYQEVIDKYMN